MREEEGVNGERERERRKCCNNRYEEQVMMHIEMRWINEEEDGYSH